MAELDKFSRSYDIGLWSRFRPDTKKPLSSAVLFIISFALSGAMLWYISMSPFSTELPTPRGGDLTPSLAKINTPFFWHTPWDSPNRTESDKLWDAVKPSHGFVALDRRRAGADGWPETMYLPSDHSKGVYLIEAYHQLHCLKIIRQTFYEAMDKRSFTYAPHHADHCFAALHQSTICNADSTLLYTFGDKTAGDGQVHQCNEWEGLRAWASSNSACYRDSVEDIPLGEHFGYCDDGNDAAIVSVSYSA